MSSIFCWSVDILMCHKHLFDFDSQLPLPFISKYINFVDHCLYQNKHYTSFFLWIHRSKQNAISSLTIDKIMFIFHEWCLLRKRRRRNNASIVYVKVKQHERKEKSILLFEKFAAITTSRYSSAQCGCEISSRTYILFENEREFIPQEDWWNPSDDGKIWISLGESSIQRKERGEQVRIPRWHMRDVIEESKNIKERKKRNEGKTHLTYDCI